MTGGFHFDACSNTRKLDLPGFYYHQANTGIYLEIFILSTLKQKDAEDDQPMTEN